MAFSISTSVDDYMSVVTTHECNRKCPFCVDKYRGQSEYISMESVDNAVTVGKENNVKDVLIVGGEPTLHPNILDICKKFKNSGFRVVMTTNYDSKKVVNGLNGIVDCLNVSNYGQVLPRQTMFTATDVTIHTLIRYGGIDTLDKLNGSIDKLSPLGCELKFSTLDPCNDWAASHQIGDFLDSIDCEWFVLFNEILGQEYRGAIIKRYDRVINKSARQSIKFHVDGTWGYSWDRGSSKTGAIL